MSALASNIEKLRDYARTKTDLTDELRNKITTLIRQYDSIKQLVGEDVNQNMNPLEKEVSDFITTNIDISTSYDGGRRRKSASSSHFPRRRSSKKRGTQRKQKRRQRRGSRRA